MQKLNVYNQITSSPTFVNARIISPYHPTRFWSPLWIAASIFFVLMAGFGLFELNRYSSNGVQAPYLEKFVPRGQKLTIKFSDGSTVFLNSGSKIRYPKNFNHKTRELYLEGEAYFDVAHDPSKPFLVHSGKVTTTVLGTAFNISSYHHDKITVTVTRGKVSVTKGHQKLGILKPDDNLVYNENDHKVIRAHVNTNKIISWKEGDLVLTNVTMEEAAEIIGRWYNVRFNFRDQSLKDCRFTVSFLKGESLAEVMKVISFINKFNYKIGDNTVDVIGFIDQPAI